MEKLNNKILSVRTDNTSTDDVIKKNTISKYTYDKDIINTKFDDFSEFEETDKIDFKKYEETINLLKQKLEKVNIEYTDFISLNKIKDDDILTNVNGIINDVIPSYRDSNLENINDSLSQLLGQNNISVEIHDSLKYQVDISKDGLDIIIKMLDNIKNKLIQE